VSYSGIGFGLPIETSVKRKVFVSYHHGGDQAYYDAFAKAFCEVYDVIYDNSLERRVDSEDVGYVMRRIREDYVTGSSCTIVLVGKETPVRKYVDWEVKATLDKQHGLIGVQLPTAPVSLQGTISVPTRLNDNINSGYALWLSWGQITANSQQLARYIAMANVKAKKLIVNNRDRRLRNG